MSFGTRFWNGVSRFWILSLGYVLVWGCIHAESTGPKIVFSATRYDFGKVRQNEGYRCCFQFRNEGDAELEIRSVKSSCGCAVPNLIKNKLKPGESSEIAVAYNPGASEGPQDKPITVESNDPLQPTVKLIVTSDVQTEIWLKETTMIIRDVDRNKPLTQEMLIFHRNPVALKVWDVKCDSPYLVPRFVKTPQGIPSIFVDYVPKPDDPPANNQIFAFVSARTNSMMTPILKFPVFLVFRAEYEFRPGTLQEETKSLPYVAELEVTGSDSAFRIDDLTADHPAIRPLVTVNDQRVNRISVTVSPIPDGETVYGNVHFRIGKLRYDCPVQITFKK